jgi:predicted DNA-binding transcriptional regulator AlpA
MICACPCKREFEPKRKNQIYYEPACRMKDKNRRWPRIRASALRALSGMASANAQQAVRAGVPPLLGAAMAQTKRERCRERNGAQESSEFLSRRQVARLLGVSVWALIKWRKQHCGPPYVKFGRNTVRYPYRHLEAWLESMRRS